MYQPDQSHDGLPEGRALIAEIRAGRRAPEAAAAACWERIERREAEVGAWQYRAWPRVEQQIEALKRRPDWRALPLAGLPIGVKDTFDTVDMPTGYGSSIYEGHRPVVDAAAVARLRAAGAILLGKTVSTEFAFWTPGKTRNPLDTTRTPGGSSSGSAAAVADGMACGALGSQTAASLMRPAAYCGVVAFKPTLGLISLAGVKPLAGSMDTVGAIGRTVDEVRLLTGAMSGRLALWDAAPEADRPGFRLVLGAEWEAAGAAARAAVRAAMDILKAAGAEVSEAPAGPPFADLARAQTTVMAYESAREFAFERSCHEARLGAALRDLFAQGEATAPELYDAAIALRDAALDRLDELFAGADFLLLPSAPDEAPALDAGTGDPIMSRAWTLLGLPSLTIPAGRGPNGLPLGLQIAGRPRADGALLRAAEWAAGRLRGAGHA